MSITREPAKWNNDAAALVRQFLSTQTGRLLLLHLDYLRPALSPERGDVNTVALQAKYVAGYEAALSNLLQLSFPERPDATITTSDYPDLDDDTLWAPDNRHDGEAPAPSAKPRVQPKAPLPPTPSANSQPPTK